MQVVTMRVVSQKLVKGKVGKLGHARFLCDVYCFSVSGAALFGIAA
ncbi:hypothetical protein [Leptolyngbya sp. ST-U4]|nr:hypothetical protein [Cyanobacteria bacterium FACHB-502]MBD2027935.1 hypothetical protein [Leptolyngbya sp. FACHB-711]